MSSFTIATQVVAFEDAGTTSNPTRKPIDWQYRQNMPVANPSTTPITVPALASFVIVDGVRPTAIDGSTVFSLTLSSVGPSRYRLSASGGTAPAFRTDRGLSLSGNQLTWSVLSNLSVIVTASSGAPFSTVRVGDVVFVPGPSTGDPSTVFSQMNEGYWTALSVGASAITVARLPGSLFSGITETVTPASSGQLVAYSVDGVQIGDTVELSAGFAAPALGAHVVAAVNPGWLEFVSTSPLGSESGIVPGAAGFTIYAAAKRYLRVEGDQEFVLRLNGDTGDGNRVTPILAGDPNLRGWFEKLGPVWRAQVVNRSSVPLGLIIFAAE